MKKQQMITNYYFTEFNGASPISVYIHVFSECELHRHDFFEFEYILEGETISEVNGREVKIGAGDLVFVTPADIHAYKSTDGLNIKTVTVHFNGEHFEHLSQDGSVVIHCSEELKNAFFTILSESSLRI